MITKFKNLSVPMKIVIIIVFLLLIVGIGVGVYMLMPKGNTFSETKKMGDKLTGEKLELKVTDIIITDKINEVKADADSSFVCIAYEYKNTSAEAIEWADFPLLTLGVYGSDQPGTPVETEFGNGDIDKDPLKQFSYVMGIDLNDALKPIEKGKVRYDAEVYKVKKSDIENKSIFITFDLFDVGIKVEDGLSKLPTLKEVLKKNKKAIKKKQKKQGITETEDDSTNSTDSNNQ